MGLEGRETGHADGRERGPDWGRHWVRKQMKRLFLEMSSGAVVSTVRSGADTQILGNVA